jgi:hypothetical protein
MGSCASKPPTVLTETALEQVTISQEATDALENPVVAPVRVFRDGQVSENVSLGCRLAFASPWPCRGLSMGVRGIKIHAICSLNVLGDWRRYHIHPKWQSFVRY